MTMPMSRWLRQRRRIVMTMTMLITSGITIYEKSEEWSSFTLKWHCANGIPLRAKQACRASDRVELSLHRMHPYGGRDGTWIGGTTYSFRYRYTGSNVGLRKCSTRLRTLKIIMCLVQTKLRTAVENSRFSKHQRPKSEPQRSNAGVEYSWISNYSRNLLHNRIAHYWWVVTKCYEIWLLITL